MAQQYDNEGRIAVFKNDKGGNDKRPDYRGPATIGGKAKPLEVPVEIVDRPARLRQLLRQPAAFERIGTLVMADSIYCGYAGPVAERQVDPALMEGFLRYARLAADGKRRMLITHTRQVPEGYASTTETAMQRSPAEPYAALTAASAAMSRSASGSTSMWFLAPPRACTRLPFFVPVS